MPDLPAIVAAIRRQRPGVVPEWLVYEVDFKDWWDYRGSSERLDVSVVEAALVGWLAMEHERRSKRQRTGMWGWCIDGDGYWYSMDRDVTKWTNHGADTIGCVRALCAANEIEVGDG